MSDDDLMAMYEQEKAKQDPVGIRQTRNIAEKDLADQRSAYQRAQDLRQQLVQFRDLNTKASSGGWWDQIPGVNNAVANMFGGPKAQMASIGAGLQVKDVPQGQGAVSNFERTHYGATQPGINKQGPDNSAIIANKLALIDKEGKRLAFNEDWLARKGNLNGASAAWDAQSGQGLIASAKAKVEARKPPAQKQGLAVGTVRKGYRFNGGNPSDPKAWSKI